MAEDSLEGESSAWTFLGTNLKLCGLSDTMQEWDVSKEPTPQLPGYCNYIFTRS